MGGTKKKDNLISSTMSLGEHIEELRIRLLYALAGLAVCSVAGFYFGFKVIHFMEDPYLAVMGEEARMQARGPADGFLSYVKISLITGLVISSPWVFYHIWMFVAAGLYQHEKRYVRYAVPFSAVLFITGSLFFIIVVAPLTLGFLVKMNDFLGLNSTYSFPLYISFMTHLMLVFGLALSVAQLFLGLAFGLWCRRRKRPVGGESSLRVRENHRAATRLLQWTQQVADDVHSHSDALGEVHTQLCQVDSEQSAAATTDISYWM